jgi:diacylglycerol kinase (ATP)
MTAPARVTVLTNPMSGHGNAPHAAEKAVARFQQVDCVDCAALS